MQTVAYNTSFLFIWKNHSIRKAVLMNKPDKGGIVSFDFASLYHFTFKISLKSDLKILRVSHQWIQNVNMMISESFSHPFRLVTWSGNMLESAQPVTKLLLKKLMLVDDFSGQTLKSRNPQTEQHGPSIRDEWLDHAACHRGQLGKYSLFAYT